jgi:hypothetical protein
MGGSQLDHVHSSAQAAVRGSNNDVECITSCISHLFVWLPVPPLAAQRWHDAAALLCSLFSDRSLRRLCCCCAAQDLQCQVLLKTAPQRDSGLSLVVSTAQHPSPSSAICVAAACRPQLQHVAFQRLPQQPAATPGTGPQARLLQCRLDAHTAALRVSSQPARAAQQQPVTCGPAAAAWLSADVRLAASPAAGARAAPAGGSHACSRVKCEYTVCQAVQLHRSNAIGITSMSLMLGLLWEYSDKAQGRSIRVSCNLSTTLRKCTLKLSGGAWTMGA